MKRTIKRVVCAMVCIILLGSITVFMSNLKSIENLMYRYSYKNIATEELEFYNWYDLEDGWRITEKIHRYTLLM